MCPVWEARAATRELADDQTVQAFVIDDLRRWLPVAGLDDGVTVEETEEIPVSANDNPSQGRSGSVCEVRKSTREPRGEHQHKKNTVNDQRNQLHGLLAPKPLAAIDSMQAYADLRTQHATLHAFSQKLKHRGPNVHVWAPGVRP